MMKSTMYVIAKLLNKYHFLNESDKAKLLLDMQDEQGYVTGFSDAVDALNTATSLTGTRYDGKIYPIIEVEFDSQIDPSQTIPSLLIGDLKLQHMFKAAYKACTFKRIHSDYEAFKSTLSTPSLLDRQVTPMFSLTFNTTTSTSLLLKGDKTEVKEIETPIEKSFYVIGLRQNKFSIYSMSDAEGFLKQLKDADSTVKGYESHDEACTIALECNKTYDNKYTEGFPVIKVKFTGKASEISKDPKSTLTVKLPIEKLEVVEMEIDNKKITLSKDFSLKRPRLDIK